MENKRVGITGRGASMSLAMIHAFTMANQPATPQRRIREYKPRGLTGRQWASRKSSSRIAKASKRNNRRK